MEVDNLGRTKRAKLGFRSSDLNPKRAITAREEGVQICLLHTDTGENEFFSAAEIGYHPLLMKEKDMVSSPQVNAALTRTMNDSFLATITEAGKEEERWQERGSKLVRLSEIGKMRQKEGIEIDRLLYYKNRLYILEDETLQTEITQGCHDLLVEGHFGQEKTIELVTGDFYWKGLANWI